MAEEMQVTLSKSHEKDLLNQTQGEKTDRMLGLKKGKRKRRRRKGVSVKGENSFPFLN